MLLSELEDPKLTKAMLLELLPRYRESPHFVRDLAEAAVSGDPALSRNGCWLLKLYLEGGGSLADEAACEILQDGLGELRHWVAHLTLCQAFADPVAQAPLDPVPLADFLRDCLRDSRTIVRAWAISAMVALAQRESAYRDEAMEAFAEGLRGEAPAMQARMKHLGPVVKGWYQP